MICRRGCIRTGDRGEERFEDERGGVRMRKILFAGAVLLAAVLGEGCGAARPVKYYQLSLPEAQPSASGPETYPISLLLEAPMAPHLYREDRIVFGTGAEQRGTYEYHRWAEPPTEMLQSLLLRELRNSNRYRSVQTLRSNTRGDFILRGRLYSFEEVSQNPLLARVSFEVELYEVRTGSTVWSQFYSRDEPAVGKDVAAVVAALDRSLRRGVTEVSAGLNQYFSAHPPK